MQEFSISKQRSEDAHVAFPAAECGGKRGEEDQRGSCKFHVSYRDILAIVFQKSVSNIL